MRCPAPSRTMRLPACRLLSLCVAVSAPAFSAGSVSDDPTQRTPANLDTVEVVGQRYLPDYSIRTSRTATKTDSRLLEVPQAITVVTDKLIADQAITSLADTFRYMPGIGLAQGEGNRDAAVLRGNGSTADFFVNGIRDDVQYVRDVYNLERVEALKGPNAMIFGRGGSGGLINRVTRQADGDNHQSSSLQVGFGNRKRGTLDYGTGMGRRDGGFRINAVYEDSESFRDGYRQERYGINPTIGIALGASSRLQLSYERFHDERVADRGVPSLNGRPLDVDPATFFGNPEQSPVDATVDAFDATLEHSFAGAVTLRNHLRWADYDKVYQNVYPGAVDGGARTVSISAYNDATTRRNLFNQTDLTWQVATARIRHTLLLGTELGRQVTGNRRLTGYFGPAGSSIASVQVPLATPISTQPLVFRASASNADIHSNAEVAAVYLQDQLDLSPHWQAIVGLRYDRFRVDLRNNRTGARVRSDDGLLSPRAGLVYKPLDNLSLYASYSIAYQPRAGEQLGSLSASTATLDPEMFRNREIGTKWDIRPDLQASVALYRLDRANVAITDPADTTRLVLVDGQTGEGVEVSLAGRITEAWQLMGGYAYQAGELTTSLSAAAPAGNRLAQLPRHSASLWNRYDFNHTVGAGIGILHRGEIFASADNLVTLPAFTRLDAALYVRVNPSMQLQLNLENLTNKRYYASAHNNNNITPGAPRSAWVGINYRY